MADAKKEKKEPYYHYTTPEGAKGIKESGVIKKSSSERGDAVFGDGTYLTQRPPTDSKLGIAGNNYDSRTNESLLREIVKSGKPNYNMHCADCFFWIVSRNTIKRLIIITRYHDAELLNRVTNSSDYTIRLYM